MTVRWDFEFERRKEDEVKSPSLFLSSLSSLESSISSSFPLITVSDLNPLLWQEKNSRSFLYLVNVVIAFGGGEKCKERVILHEQHYYYYICRGMINRREGGSLTANSFFKWEEGKTTTGKPTAKWSLGSFQCKRRHHSNCVIATKNEMWEGRERKIRRHEERNSG